MGKCTTIGCRLGNVSKSACTESDCAADAEVAENSGIFKSSDFTVKAKVLDTPPTKAMSIIIEKKYFAFIVESTPKSRPDVIKLRYFLLGKNV